MSDATATGIQIITRLPVERWPEYRELRLRALKTDPQAFGQSYDEAVNHPEERWRQRLLDAAEGKSWLVFAEQDGRLIGMSGAYQWPEDLEANRAMIIAVFVDPELRGQRIGERLVQAVLDQLRAAGLCSAILAVNPEQVAAVRLYERMGFIATGTEVNQLGNGQECEETVMERSLLK
jgi:ribosomal protein S18 acetylase RimI-like enzyme